MPLNIRVSRDDLLCVMSNDITFRGRQHLSLLVSLFRLTSICIGVCYQPLIEATHSSPRKTTYLCFQLREPPTMSPETIYSAAMALTVCPDSVPNLEHQASVVNDFNSFDMERSTTSSSKQSSKDEAEIDFKNTTTPDLDHSDEVINKGPIQKLNSCSISMACSESAVSSRHSTLVLVGTHLLQIRLPILTDA